MCIWYEVRLKDSPHILCTHLADLTKVLPNGVAFHAEDWANDLRDPDGCCCGVDPEATAKQNGLRYVRDTESYMIDVMEAVDDDAQGEDQAGSDQG